MPGLPARTPSPCLGVSMRFWLGFDGVGRIGLGKAMIEIKGAGAGAGRGEKSKERRAWRDEADADADADADAKAKRNESMETSVDGQMAASWILDGHSACVVAARSLTPW